MMKTTIHAIKFSGQKKREREIHVHVFTKQRTKHITMTKKDCVACIFSVLLIWFLSVHEQIAQWILDSVNMDRFNSPQDLPDIRVATLKTIKLQFFFGRVGGVFFSLLFPFSLFDTIIRNQLLEPMQLYFAINLSIYCFCFYRFASQLPTDIKLLNEKNAVFNLKTKNRWWPQWP